MDRKGSEAWESKGHYAFKGDEVIGAEATWLLEGCRLERERQKVEGRWDVGAEPGMSALRLTDGTQQEWERPALALRGVPGNVIKHPADPLVTGIWIPPGPPAHPDPQLAVLTGSRQEKRPALLARPVSMSSSATNPSLLGLPQAGAGGRGSGWELMEPGRPCQWPWLGHPNRKPRRRT